MLLDFLHDACFYQTCYKIWAWSEIKSGRAKPGHEAKTCRKATRQLSAYICAMDYYLVEVHDHTCHMLPVCQQIITLFS